MACVDDFTVSLFDDLVSSNNKVVKLKPQKQPWPAHADRGVQSRGRGRVGFGGWHVHSK